MISIHQRILLALFVVWFAPVTAIANDDALYERRKAALTAPGFGLSKYGGQTYQLTITDDAAGADIAAVINALPYKNDIRSVFLRLNTTHGEHAGLPAVDLGIFTTLPGLESLTVWQTRLRNYDAIGRLEALKELTLETVNLNDLTVLCTAPQLESLDLDNLDVPTLAPLMECPRLSALALETTRIADIASLSSLTRLEELKVKGMRLPGLDMLAPLTSLKKLDMHQPVYFADGHVSINALTNMTDMEELKLGMMRIEDLRPIAGMTKLQRLEISLPEVPFSTDLIFFRNLTNLEYVKLQNVPLIHLDGFRDATGLTYLDIRNRTLADASGLTALVNLEEFNPKPSRPSRAAAAFQLRLSFRHDANAKNWSLQNTNFSNPALLAHMSELIRLDIAYTEIRDLAGLSGMTGLEDLDIGSTRISDLSPISSLKELRRLVISSTKVKDISIVRRAAQARFAKRVRNTDQGLVTCRRCRSTDKRLWQKVDDYSPDGSTPMMTSTWSDTLSAGGAAKSASLLKI